MPPPLTIEELKQFVVTRQVTDKFKSTYLVRDITDIFKHSAPFEINGNTLIICQASIELESQLVQIEGPQAFTFEQQFLCWLNHQLIQQDSQLVLNTLFWRKTKAYQHWLNLFIRSWELFPATQAIEQIAATIIDDMADNFEILFKILPIIRPHHIALHQQAVQRCLFASFLKPDYRFQLLSYLSEVPDQKQSFIELAQNTALVESKDINAFAKVLDSLVKYETWHLVQTYAYRIIALRDNHHPEFAINSTIASLILANIRLNKWELAIANYQKYWTTEFTTTAFTYTKELVFGLHSYAPHHPIIENLVANLDPFVQDKALQDEDPYSYLFAAKKLEFAEAWEEALAYYKKIYSLDQPEWLGAVACFVANNTLYQEDFSPTIWKNIFAWLKRADKPKYHYIAALLRICVMNKTNHTLVLEQAERLFTKEEKPTTLPPPNTPFLSFLLPRILEALLLSEQRSQFEKTLKDKLAIQYLQQNDRAFLKILFQLDTYLQHRRQHFDTDDLESFILNVRQALSLSLDNIQLKILLDKFNRADKFIPKDDFRDYKLLDAALLKELLILKVALRLEPILEEQASRLTQRELTDAKQSLKEMTIKTAVANLNNLG